MFLSSLFNLTSHGCLVWLKIKETTFLVRNNNGWKRSWWYVTGSVCLYTLSHDQSLLNQRSANLSDKLRFVQKEWWCLNVTRLPNMTSIINLHIIWRAGKNTQLCQVRDFILLTVMTICVTKFMMQYISVNLWCVNASLVNLVFKEGKNGGAWHRQPAEAVGTSVVDSFSGLPVHLMWLISAL